jgi:quercetin dioxygenase-like cupin family protein
MKRSDDAVGGVLGEAGEPGDTELLVELSRVLTPRAPSGGARDRLLSSALSPALRWAPHFDKLSRLFDMDEAGLQRIAQESALAERWENLPLPGVRLFHLVPGPALAGADAGLVSIAAGTPFPLHEHVGEERTLVLEGALSETDGTLYRPGDSLTMLAGSSHAFTVLPGPALVYAVVLFAPIEIDGLRFPPASR